MSGAADPPSQRNGSCALLTPGARGIYAAESATPPPPPTPMQPPTDQDQMPKKSPENIAPTR